MKSEIMMTQVNRNERRAKLMNKIYLVMFALCLMLVVVPFVDAKQSNKKVPVCKTLDNLEVGWNYFNYTDGDNLYLYKNTFIQYNKVKKNLTEAYKSGWINSTSVNTLMQHYHYEEGWLHIGAYNLDQYYQKDNLYALKSNLRRATLQVCK